MEHLGGIMFNKGDIVELKAMVNRKRHGNKYKFIKDAGEKNYGYFLHLYSGKILVRFYSDFEVRKLIKGKGAK